MQRYLARRLSLFFPSLLLASVVIFIIMRVLPGDVALSILGGEEGEDVLDSAQLEAIRKELGLTDPLPVQYGKWMWSMVNGEFGGRSLITREPIVDVVARRMPKTIQLALYTFILSSVFAIPMGVMAAVYQNRAPDYAARLFSIAGHAVPNFWTAIMVLLALVLFFRWTPPLFYKEVWQDPGVHFQKVVWPVLILAWGFSSNLVRVTRSNTLEVLRQDYVRTARSKGLTESVVLWRHTLRNALVPVVTVAGLQLEGLLSGTVILESIFGIPGIGQGIILAASDRDYPIIQSLVLVLVVVALTLNLLVDLIYSFVDPRIKYS